MKRYFLYFPTLGCQGDIPAVVFDDCAPVFNLSEIKRIFIGKKIAAPFTDATQEAEWTTRLSQNSTSGDDYLRTLVVRGNKPAPAPVKKLLTNKRNITITKNHTLNFLIDESNQTNHDFLVELEESGIQEIRFWYETFGGKMFGGNEGIVAFIDLNMVLNEGNEEIQTYAGALTWEKKTTEKMSDSPIFDNDNSGSSTTFDTILTFVSSNSDVDNGVTGTIAASDPDAQFQFNEITPLIGTPKNMDINIGGIQFMSVDFPDDYLGAQFRVIDQSGTSHIGVFAEGNVNF